MKRCPKWRDWIQDLHLARFAADHRNPERLGETGMQSEQDITAVGNSIHGTTCIYGFMLLPGTRELRRSEESVPLSF
jgi:hypothetical protein